MSEMNKPAAKDAAQHAHVHIMRSPLGLARGLGSAKSGVGQWWGERLTAIALVPLTLWFIASVYSLIGAGQAEMAVWMSNPITLVLMLLLVVITFHHMQLGLQVVVEDYVHKESTLFALLLINKAVALVLGLTAVVCVLRIGL